MTSSVPICSAEDVISFYDLPFLDVKNGVETACLIRFLFFARFICLNENSTIVICIIELLGKIGTNKIVKLKQLNSLLLRINETINIYTCV